MKNLLIKLFLLTLMPFVQIFAQENKAPSFTDLKVDALEVAAGDRSLLNIHLNINPTNPGQELYVSARIDNKDVNVTKLGELEYAAFSHQLNTTGTSTWRVDVYLQDIEKVKELSLSIIKLENEINEIESLLQNESDEANRTLLNSRILKNRQLIQNLKVQINKERVHLEVATMEINVLSALVKNPKASKSGLEPLLVSANKPNLIYTEGEVATFTSTVTTEFTADNEPQEVVIRNKLKGKRLGVTKGSAHIFLSSSAPFTSDDLGDQQFVSELYLRSLPRSNSIRSAVTNAKTERAGYIRSRNATSDPILKTYYQRKIDDVTVMIKGLNNQLENILSKFTTKSLAITIQVDNQPPVLADDVSFELDEDSSLVFEAPLATDPNGDELTYIVVAAPTNGMLSSCFQGGRSCTFTPNPDFSGSSFITYKVNDGVTDSASVGTINFVINGINDAPVAGADQSEALNQDELLTFTVNAGTDLENDTLTYIAKSGPQNGTLENCFEAANPRTCSYRPNSGHYGTDAITYAVSDGSLESANQAAVTFTINGRPSVAADDNFSLNEDSTALLAITAGTDPEGSPLTYTVVAGPSHGTLSNCFQGRNCEFTPNENYNGPDTFTYKVNDGALDSETVGTVNLTVNPVNDLPVFATTSVEFQTNEDTSISFEIPAATDVDGDALTYTLISNPTNGTLSGCADGTDARTCTFTPGENYFGTVNFFYAANDGTSVSAEGVSVTIEVAPINDLPVPGADQSFDLIAGEAFPLEVSEASDVDTDLMNLSYIVISEPANGVLSNCFEFGRECTYTPDATFAGTDSFQYVINDGLGTSIEIATVTFNVEGLGPSLDDSFAEIRSSGLPAFALVGLSGPMTGGNYPVAAYEFDFGDNSKITLPADFFEDPSDISYNHEYATAGNYTIKVVAINTNGERSNESITQLNVTGGSIPSVRFNYTVTDTGSGYQVDFDASATTSDDGISLYRWRYGDGTPDDRGATFVTASHVYQDPNVYQLRLTVVDNNGGRSDVRVPIFVGVPAENTAPVPFVKPLTSLNVAVGENISISAADSFDLEGDNLTFEWHVSDSQATSEVVVEGETLNYAFKKSGTYPILLYVSDSNGGTSEYLLAAYVKSAAPQPFSLYAHSFDSGSLTVEFNTYFNYYSNAYAARENVFWEFGDGEFGQGTFTAHTFAAPGTYTVKATTRTIDGNFITAQKDIVVDSASAVPSANLLANGNIFQTMDAVQFEAQASNPGGGATDFEYTFDFGDENWTSGASGTVEHTYSEVRSYLPIVLVTNAEGFSVDASTHLIVRDNFIPTPSFYVTHMGSNKVFFDAYDSFDRLGMITDYHWELGDGTVVTGPSIEHDYAIASDYEVVLQVTDLVGQTAEYRRYVTITNSQLPDSSSSKSVAVGSNFACATHLNDKIQCWGAGDKGQLGNGLAFTIGMGDSNFGLWRTPSRVGYAASANEFSDVKAGLEHACGLVNGELLCWGLNDQGQLGYGNNDNIGDDESLDSVTPIALGTGIVEFALGRKHTCALTADNRVFCWGDNSFGQLAQGDTTSSNLPVELALDPTEVVQDIFAGGDHSCLLFNDRSVKCWGRNTNGQLGYGDTDSRGDNEVLTAISYVDVLDVSSPYEIESMALGGNHSCVLLAPKTGETAPRAVRCIGRGAEGQLGLAGVSDLGDDEIISNLTNIELSETPSKVFAGGNTTCALSTLGNIQCFGLNDKGQLGYGFAENIGDDETPASVGLIPTAKKFTSISLGTNHTCAVTTLGEVKCWGQAELTGLGLYATDDAIGNNEEIDTVGAVNLSYAGSAFTAAGPNHLCNRSQSGAVRCWGLNDSGQLGLGHTTNIGNEFAPFAAGNITLGAEAQQIAVGGKHSCAVMQDGSVKCWGLNDHGQLGINLQALTNVGDDESPVAVAGVQIGDYWVRELALGKNHTCAILDPKQTNPDQTPGKVKCWGLNDRGQLGVGNTNTIGDDEHPTSGDFVDIGGEAKFIKSYADHTCVQRADDRLVCWGLNTRGQLGLGHVNNIGDDELVGAYGLVSVGGTNDLISDFGVGELHTCAVRKDTIEVICWGENLKGQLGQGHTDYLGIDELPSAIPPINLGSFTTLNKIGLGKEHTCVTVDDHAIKCWGSNSMGQLGIGSTEDIGDDETPGSISFREFFGGQISVHAGDDYTCTGYEYSEPVCWGNGNYGALGRGLSEVFGDDSGEDITALRIVNVAKGDWTSEQYGPVATIQNSWVDKLAGKAMDFWKNAFRRLTQYMGVR